MYRIITLGLDRYILKMFDDIKSRFDINFEVVENERIPEGKNGHLSIKRIKKDGSKSLIYQFSDMDSLEAWVIGFHYACEHIHLPQIRLQFSEF